MREILNGARPKFPEDGHAYSIAVEESITSAWNGNPEERPTASDLLSLFGRELHPDPQQQEREKEKEKEPEEEDHQEAAFSELMDVLQSPSQDNNLKEEKSESYLIKQERCDAVEEVGKVEVKQSEECGIIICLAEILRLSVSRGSKLSFRKSSSKSIPAVVGGTSRGFLLFWNSKGEHIQTLKVQEGRVNNLLFLGGKNTIWVGGHDGFIYLVPLQSKKGEQIVESDSAVELTSLAVENQHVWAGGVDGSIFILDKQLVIQLKIQAHQGSNCSLLNVHGQMLSASYDHSIHIWDQHENGEWKVKDILKGHQGSVFQLVIAHGYIWSEAADGTRILWKPFVWEYQGHMEGQDKKGCVGSSVLSLGEDGMVWVSCSHERNQHLHFWRIRNPFMKSRIKEIARVDSVLMN